ncbi:MAG: hypothetical protein Q8S32_12225 [Burkholderiaceae bacterium]|nr:hypothetical protein [Burkholderiaceae bacterium]
MAYDWVLIKSEFVEGITKDGEPHDPTLQELSDKHGPSMSTIKKRSARDNWVQERNLYRTKVEQKVQEKKAIHLAGESASFGSNALDTTKKLINRIKTELDNPELSPHELQKLSSSLKDGVQSGNLILGEPTEHKEQSGSTQNNINFNTTNQSKILEEEGYDK